MMRFFKKKTKREKIEAFFKKMKLRNFAFCLLESSCAFNGTFAHIVVNGSKFTLETNVQLLKEVLERGDVE